MIEFVEKKDGRIQAFVPEKLKNGLFKAVKAAGGNDKEKSDLIAEKIINNLNEKFKGTNKVKYIDILDEIETTLVKNGHDKTARAFILFRYRDSMLRKQEDVEKDNILMKHYLDKSDWTIKENANTNYSLSAMNFNISQKITQNYWLSEIYPEHISKAHIDAEIHIHDLGVFGAYCCGWNLEDVLKVGFTGAPGCIYSRPPKHFRSALGIMNNFLFSVQNEIAGACAFSNVDTLLAPFIRYDNLDRKQVKQALQEFVFNLNVPTRSAMQTPFTNLTFDLICPKHMKGLPVVIAGEMKDENYGDFQKEMDLINDVFCEVLLEGDGNGRVFTFPIPTYNITKDFNWEDKNLDNLWKLTSKYGSPYFTNYINSSMSVDDARSFCCRLKSDITKVKYRGNGLFGAYPLVGSLGVCTINLPRIGIKSKSKEEFFKELDRLANICHESLEIKRKIIEKYTEQGLYPFSKFYLRSIKEKTGEYWANHFSTIGILGMEEALLNMNIGGMETKEGIEFAKEVLEFLNKKAQEFESQTGRYTNIEAVPGEGATRRFAHADKKKYPNCIIANEKDYKEKGIAPYYTNSTNIPVSKNIDLFKQFELQNEIQPLYTGGIAFHIYAGEAAPSADAVKSLIKKSCENYKIPYFSFTPTFSICPIHGYLNGKHKLCPKCLDINDKMDEVI